MGGCQKVAEKEEMNGNEPAKTGCRNEKKGWLRKVPGVMVTGTLQQEQMQNGEQASE